MIELEPMKKEFYIGEKLVNVTRNKCDSNEIAIQMNLIMKQTDLYTYIYLDN